MKDYMAPMEGVTNYIYRNAYHQFYHPMDKYFTPFISAKPNKRFSDKEIGRFPRKIIKECMSFHRFLQITETIFWKLPGF